MANTVFPQPTTLYGEKRVALRSLTWQAYQQILHALPQSRAARLTYDRGTLEITMPLEDHEFAIRLIELFIRILVVEMGMKMKTMVQQRWIGKNCNGVLNRIVPTIFKINPRWQGGMSILPKIRPQISW